MLQKETIKFFDVMAQTRNAQFAREPILEYEQIMRSGTVISMLNPQPTDSILDVGCGNGRDLIELAKKNIKECVGVDISEGMVREARKELLKNNIKNIKAEVGDATCLRFPNERFDKIFASEVLEHIPEYELAVKEMARVLRKGGHLVVTTPNRYSMYGFDRYIIHQRIFQKKWKHPYDSWKTFSELKTAIENNGLKVVDASGICYIPGFLIPYRLPKFAKKMLILLVSKIEKTLNKMFPKNGAVICIKARKI